MILLPIAAAVVGYLLGSVPFGLLLTRAAGLGDIRNIGSRSIGATNVLRTGRKGLAAATVLLDGAKGAAAVLIGGAIAGPPGVFAGGIASVVGHAFPVWLRFRAGREPDEGVGCYQHAEAGRHALAAAPLIAWALRAEPTVLALSLCIGALIWLRHRANIERLLAGTEPRIGRG